MAEAARRARLQDLIERLPQGLNTPLGERGQHRARLLQQGRQRGGFGQPALGVSQNVAGDHRPVRRIAARQMFQQQMQPCAKEHRRLGIAVTAGNDLGPAKRGRGHRPALGRHERRRA